MVTPGIRARRFRQRRKVLSSIHHRSHFSYFRVTQQPLEASNITAEPNEFL